MIRNKLCRISGFLGVLSLTLVMASCASEPVSTDERANVNVNVNPLTLDDAVVSLEKIERLRTQDPGAADEALSLLQPRLDELNGLVARVEPSPGRVVSFYEPLPGMINVGERGPRDAEPLLTPSEVRNTPAVDLYRRLSGGADAPAALLAAQQRHTDVKLAAATTLESVDSGGACSQSFDPDDAALDTATPGTRTEALTQADGPYFRDNLCFKTGNATGCFPDHWNGGFTNYNTKASFLRLAPFYGDGVTVRWKYKGSTLYSTVAYTGELATYTAHSEGISCCCCGIYDLKIANHRWDILNATNDGFHWSQSQKWSCVGWVSCQTIPS